MPETGRCKETETGDNVVKICDYCIHWSELRAHRCWGLCQSIIVDKKMSNRPLISRHDFGCIFYEEKFTPPVAEHEEHDGRG